MCQSVTLTGGEMCFKLLFPIPQQLITVSISCFSLKCLCFPSLFPLISPKKKKILPVSGTEFRFTCKFIVFCPSHEGYTISKSVKTSYRETPWHLLFLTYPFSDISLLYWNKSIKSACSAEISRYMYVAKPFWVKSVTVGKGTYLFIYMLYTFM